VNCVVPGLVITELWDKQGQSKERQQEIFDAAAKSLPVGFAGRPEDIAEAYLYAIRADYATGTLIEIGESIVYMTLFGRGGS
jgi:NAD(P)-dependent dehydrogenase (short-subunit alcohol dehydrogenase family)